MSSITDDGTEDTPLLMSAWVCVAIIVALVLWRYADRQHAPYYVLAVTYIGWFFPSSIIILLPADLTSVGLPLLLYLFVYERLTSGRRSITTAWRTTNARQSHTFMSAMPFSKWPGESSTGPPLCSPGRSSLFYRGTSTMGTLPSGRSRSRPSKSRGSTMPLLAQ